MEAETRSEEIEDESGSVHGFDGGETPERTARPIRERDFEEALASHLDRIERKLDGALGGIAEIVPVTRELREFFNAVSSSPMAKRMLGKKKGGDEDAG